MKPILRVLVVAAYGLLVLASAGCGGGSAEASPEAVPQVTSPQGPNCLFNATSPGCAPQADAPPFVAFTSRSDGALDAAVNTDVVATMSEALDPASVNAGTIRLVGDDNAAIPGTTEYDAKRAALVFRPTADLLGRRYTATVDAGVRDAAGNRMGRAFSWSFTVDAARRDTDPQRAIQQLLDAAAHKYNIPGSIIAIRDDQGRTWKTTNGYADIALRTPIQSNMLFRMGSNTKTYVGTLVLQLADAGKLALDDPVNKYLKEEMTAYLPSYDGDAITLRHLLRHTSGIANFTLDADWGNAFISDPSKQYFPQELLMIADKLSKAPTAPKFGSFFYSNTNYILLGLIVRKASGMVYENALRNAIFLPWGMEATYAPPLGDASLKAPFSRGYWEDGETGTLHDVTLRDSSTVWSSGNLVTSITDLVRWGELLGRGTLLASATQAQRLQTVPMDDHLNYGLGIVRDSSANLIGHQGGMIGYTSQTYHVPDKGYTLAFFYNRTLALHDYSHVMTYDTLVALWPDRPLNRPALKGLPTVRPAPVKPGFLTEYQY